MILNHAYFRGFYLIVLDRRNLKTVLKKNYDTVKDGTQEMLTGDKFDFYKTSFEYETVNNEKTGNIIEVDDS